MNNPFTRFAPVLATLALVLLASPVPAQCLEGDCVNGSGVKLTRGHKYSGSFKDNHREGFGIYYFPNGDRYEGDFVKGKMHGEGAYISANGDRYEGEFSSNTRSGVGTYFYENGEYVKGVWENGKLVEPYAEVVSEDLADEENPDSVGVVPWGSGEEEEGRFPDISLEPDQSQQQHEPDAQPEPDAGPPAQ